eukprot:s1744_g9.t1
MHSAVRRCPLSRTWSLRQRLPQPSGHGFRRQQKRLLHGVSIPQHRLTEFLWSDVCYLADQGATPLSLCQVIAATPLQVAELANRELPIRFAKRIRQIEDIPGWHESQDLVKLRYLYFQCFSDLRLIDLKDHELHDLTVAVTRTKHRLNGAISLLMEALQELKDKGLALQESFLEPWLDRFLLSRIGTEMLTSHYVASMEGSSIVEKDCDPTIICLRAAERARWLCMEHYKRIGNTVKIKVETLPSRENPGNTKERHCFTYVPKYLYYMVLELLKNSARATIETSSSQEEIEARPIVVTVSANSGQVAIRIQDMAGGIPFEVAERVWSYTYSTADTRSDVWEHQGTPLAGYGVGLPLSRLYAQYLGGSLNLMSMPGEGTTAFLHLKRLQRDAREQLPLWHGEKCQIGDGMNFKNEFCNSCQFRDSCSEPQPMTSVDDVTSTSTPASTASTASSATTAAVTM